MATCVLLSACGATRTVPAATDATAPDASGSWPYPNGNIANTRDAVGSTISSANVSRLEQAWTFELTGSAAGSVAGAGSLAAAPIVRDGVVYIQDLHSNVYALALATGDLKWEYKVGQSLRSGPGPNGVAVVNGTVYGAAPTSAFALNAATGRRLWVNNHLLGKGQGTFGIQPQVLNGRVYLASGYGSGPGGGVVLALAASTGKVLWRFDTVLHRDKGVQAVGLGSGGAWETPLVGRDGSVTFGTGNPYQTVGSAIEHPSAQLYTDSDVNLDAATGKLRWYYQGVPNDFKDYDMQASPMSATVRGVPVVIGGGKMGIVYEMNARTGRLIWKMPVGEHNGHDDDSLLALQHKSTLKLPFTFLPGSIGGVLTNMSLAGNTVYVATCDVPFTLKSRTQVLGTVSRSFGGQIEALNLTTGRVEWDTKLSDLPLGATTVSNDLIFTTLYEGVLIALDRTTGKIVFRQKLPASANSPIAIAGNTVLVPAGGVTTKTGGGHPQLLAYTAP